MVLDPKLAFAIVSTVIGIAAFLPYLLDMFARRTRPHLYTWVIWCVTQGTAVAGLWYGNGGFIAFGFAISTALVFLVALLSFWYGTRNITRSDTIILFLALLAVVVWWQLDNPILAIFMVAAIDVIGYIPSYRKSVTEPWAESAWVWFAFSLSNVLALFALNEYNFLTVTYIAAIMVANGLLAAICFWFRRHIPKPI